LIENDDLEGTVRLLQRWLSATGESRQEMRAAALRCFLSRFEIEQVAGKLVEVLEQAAGSTSNPSPIALSATA
jgi:glycosyltransferase involved in cell wall biosynthesis